jgi:hypothetical protein
MKGDYALALPLKRSERDAGNVPMRATVWGGQSIWVLLTRPTSSASRSSEAADKMSSAPSATVSGDDTGSSGRSVWKDLWALAERFQAVRHPAAGSTRKPKLGQRARFRLFPQSSVGHQL